MSYQGFIWKNGTRNKRRTVLTILSVALALFVLSTLVTFVREIERFVEESDPLRLVTRQAASLANPLPARHRGQIERVPGVVAVTPLGWFRGVYIDPAHTDFAQHSCDPQTLFDVYRGIRISPEQKQAFIRERRAVIVGRRTAEKHGWRLGDRIALKGENWPVDLELTIRGVFSGTPSDESQIFFHHAYLDEALGRPGLVNAYWIRVDSTESVPRIIDRIDAMFQNTAAPTKTETEKAFQTSFISMLGNLRLLVAAISSVIVFSLLLVTANTMAMSVRERIREIAILKSLGFRRRKLLDMLISEGVLMTLTGGLGGCLGARMVFSFVDMASFTRGLFPGFEISWGIIALGLVISILVGVLSAVIPAYQAANLTVTDGLRHVG